MQHFPIDDDLVSMVWRLSNPQPFEHLTFSDALRRVLAGPRIPRAERDLALSEGMLAKLDALPNADELALSEALLAELEALPDGAVERLQLPGYEIRRRERKPSPKASQWVACIPDLASIPGLTNWQSICSYLRVEVGGDSARRRLQTWVAANRPGWPAVPDA